jgi:hypothetical protein
MQEVAEADMQRVLMLQRLAERVPYYDTIQSLVADPTKPTVAAQASTYVKAPERGRGQLPLNGFDDSTVFRMHACAASELLSVHTKYQTCGYI